MFNTSYDCADEDCNAKFCEKCSETELKECQYCNESFCTKCLVAHTPDCKEENETTESDDEEIDGMTFSNDKKVCIIDLGSISLVDCIEHLTTLKKDYELDKDLSDENSLVWFKKVV